MKLWLLLVSDMLQGLGSVFKVEITSGNDSIDDLKEKVKEERQLSHVSPADLTVWKCMDPMITFGYGSREVVNRQVREVFSSQKFEEVDGRHAIAELSIIKDKILLVQLPAQSGTSFTHCHYHQEKTYPEIFTNSHKFLKNGNIC
ncbi:hypothetical protein EDB89DRAFT_1902560 [Lactarius sanguifluus]|nr:hypothetical protein EDB89DRAFT_1902560 [Lactarius sanguifluus]